MLRIRDRLIQGTALNLIAVVFNQGSTLIANILVARILLKQCFGEYAMVQSTLLTVSSLSQLATGYTAAKYIAEFRASNPERAGRIMGVCSVVSFVMACVGTILIIVMSPWLAGRLLNAPHLAVALMTGSGYLFFSAINGFQAGALAGLEAFRSLAKAGVISGLFAVSSISLGAWWGGLNGSLIGLSISALVRCLIHKRWLSHECRTNGIIPQYRDSLRQEKDVILKFTLPAALAGLYSLPMIWLANSFLVRQPNGYGEMALFTAANSFRIMAAFLPNVMKTVGLSVLNSEKAIGNSPHYHRIFRNNVRHIGLVSLGGALALGLFGRPILGLFGKDFGAGRFVLWLLLSASVFEGLGLALHQYAQSKAKIWRSVLTITMPRDAFLVLAAYHLVQSYGSAGLATAYLGSAFLGFLLHYVLYLRLYSREHTQLSAQ